ncbi:GGDEF domain-containing protein [Dyella flagellata]|uniref:diguanylate cyclase n=1 Tax=Dyella flagellata TaxID=1867833 RepID=A0ABQ5XAP7_9GAMM|nr:GGDEF domain-containing protein [Dyella flagellata]
MAWCLLVPVVHGATSIAHPGEFLDQAERLRTKDHPQFLQMLERIHREGPQLSEAEQWHLRYLDAWETMFEGNYLKSEAAFHQIIEQSGDPVLIAKASGLLLSNLSINRRYEEAFALANRLASNLSAIKNPQVRFPLLTNLSQMLDFAGQTDLAVQYALMAQEAIPAGESPCRPLAAEAAALYNGKRLTSASPELQRAIDACLADHDPVLANSMRLMLGSLYIDEGHPEQALALLDRVAPSVRSNHYYPHMLSSRVERAQAYLKLGHVSEAKKAALEALAISQPDDTGEWLTDDYQVLYQVEKQQGHDAAALAYYEHYSSQEKSHLDDLRTKALAYDMAEQHFLVQKMQAERLSKQNSILKLQQSLTTKAIESGRLSIALLLVVLISVVFWLLRIKRSQLRFKQLSCLDGLTGISHHQHFIGEAQGALQLLEKRGGSACLIAIDLDHFKQINDTHGHALGDTVLRRTVAICQQQLRRSDLFGRLGGEEFCILLLDCDRDQGIALAESIRMAIEATLLDIDGVVVTFSASFGLASINPSGYDLHRLCRDADAALYKAKRNGRNRVVADTGNGSLATALA